VKTGETGCGVAESIPVTAREGTVCAFAELTQGTNRHIAKTEGVFIEPSLEKGK